MNFIYILLQSFLIQTFLPVYLRCKALQMTSVRVTVIKVASPSRWCRNVCMYVPCDYWCTANCTRTAIQGC